jgi:flagellar basal-body rod protein FlgB
MSIDNLFDSTIHLAEKALNLRSRRHERILSNIANADTPHYKAFDLMVDEALAQDVRKTGIRLKKTDPAHLGAGGLSGDSLPAKPVDVSSQVTLRGDGNTVDMEREMSALTDNQLHYRLTSQIVAKKFSKIRSIIQGGKG